MGIILLESLLTTSKQGVEQEKNMYGFKFGGSRLKSVQVLWRFRFKGLGLRVGLDTAAAPFTGPRF